MKTQEFKAHWDLLKGDIKEKWGKLTDDEIEQAKGNVEQLIAKIQLHYSETKKDIKKNLDDLLSNLNGSNRLSDSIRHVGKKVQSYSEELAQKSEHYMEKGEQYNQEPQKKAEENLDSLITYIKAHPLKSAAIAAGAGLLLGKIFGK